MSSKHRPLSRLFPKGSKKSYKVQAARAKSEDVSSWRQVSATPSERSVSVPEIEFRKVFYGDQRRNAESSTGEQVPHESSGSSSLSGKTHTTKRSLPALPDSRPASSTTSAAAPSASRQPLQNENYKKSKHSKMKQTQDPETVSLDSVSRIIAACVDSDVEGDNLLQSTHMRRQTKELDAEIHRLLDGEESSSEGDSDNSSEASLTSIHVEHDDITSPLETSSPGHIREAEGAVKNEEGETDNINALYILYGPDGKRGDETLLDTRSQASTPSSGAGSPRIPQHPISIRSGTLTKGSKIYIDSGDTRGKGSQRDLTSSSSSEDEDEEESSEVRSRGLPKSLSEELEEAQRPQSARSRKSGVFAPSMEQMRMLLESLADTESNFSSSMSSDSNAEQLPGELERGRAAESGLPQRTRHVVSKPLGEPERGKTAGSDQPVRAIDLSLKQPLPNTSQQNDTQSKDDTLTFDMLAMTRSEISVASEGSEEEEEEDTRDTIRPNMAPIPEASPNLLQVIDPNAQLTLDMLGTESGSESGTAQLTLDMLATVSDSESAADSTVSEMDSQTSTLRRADTGEPLQGQEQEGEEKNEEEEEEEEEPGSREQGERKVDQRVQNERLNLEEMLAQMRTTGVSLDTSLPGPSGFPGKPNSETADSLGRESVSELVRRYLGTEIGTEVHAEPLISLRRDLTPEGVAGNGTINEAQSKQQRREVEEKVEAPAELEEVDLGHTQDQNRPHAPGETRTWTKESVTTKILNRRNDSSQLVSEGSSSKRDGADDVKPQPLVWPKPAAELTTVLPTNLEQPSRSPKEFEFEKLLTPASDAPPSPPSRTGFTGHNGNQVLSTTASPQDVGAAHSTVPQKPSLLRHPQVFAGLPRDHAQPPPAPIRPRSRQQPKAAAVPAEPHTIVSPALPRPVPKPRKKVPNPPAHGSIPTSPTLESTQTRQAEMGTRLLQSTELLRSTQHLEQEVPQGVGVDGLAGSRYLLEKVAQMEEQHRLLMDAFQRERQALWSVINKQAHIIRKMHNAGLRDSKRMKGNRSKLHRRVRAVEQGVLSVGRECATLEARLVASETSQRTLSQALSRQQASHDAGTRGGAVAGASERQDDITPVLRQRKISLLSQHKVTKLKRFFGDNPPLLELFLQRLGYEQYLPQFLSERIGLLELPHISEEQLVALGIPMGPRLRIMNEAQLL